MNDNESLTEALCNKTFKAKFIPRTYPYHIDYWLIGKGNSYVDAKRIAPIILLLAYLLPAWMLFDMSMHLEVFSHLLMSNTFTDQSRTDFIYWRIKEYWSDGAYYVFIKGFFFTPLFFLLSIHLVFAPYPRPVRFNQKNGLVYTKYMGKIWVTDWNTAAVKLWRGNNAMLPGTKTYRGIMLQIHSLDKHEQLKSRWVMLSATSSNKDNDLVIGGDPSLLYWHWLNEYMRGAVFEGDSAPEGRAKRVIPKPKIGRLPVFEALMCFRGYKFSPRIDKKALEMDKVIKTKGLYPRVEGEKLPNNPFFTWEYDFPDRVIPNKDGIIGEAEIAEKAYRDQKAKDDAEMNKQYIQSAIAKQTAQVNRARELEPILKAQGIKKSYRDYTVKKLEEALTSDTHKTPEELEFIQICIELDGYENQR